MNKSKEFTKKMDNSILCQVSGFSVPTRLSLGLVFLLNILQRRRLQRAFLASLSINQPDPGSHIL